MFDVKKSFWLFMARKRKRFYWRSLIQTW